jgi:glycerol transport system substrate-binding protein
MRRKKWIIIGCIAALCLCATGLATAVGAKEGAKEAQYLEAASEIADIVGTNTVLTREQLLEELQWFAKAAAPYRGQRIRACYESVPLTMWEAENLGPLFEKLTGIKADIEGISGDETMRKMRMEAETKQGSYDTINIDQDMVGFFTFVGGAADLTKLMEEHPELNSPYLDLEDFTSDKICRDALNGHLYILCDYQKPVGTVYRKDWFTDPQNKAAFRQKYGYELMTPQQWFERAMQTKNVKDDWTFEKSLDVAEFFTRPDKNMYGTIVGMKPGWHFAWFFNDCLDQVAGLGSKATGPPLKTLPPHCRPYSQVYGVKYAEDGKTLLGASVSRGGQLNSEKGITAFKYLHYDLPKYAPTQKIREKDTVEAYVAFGIEGNYAFNLQHMCFFPTYNGADSKVKGVYECAPMPVSEKYFQYGMVRGYWDAEGWAITEGSKHKEATWLFAQFMTSKSVGVYKNLEGIMPIRYSTIKSKQMMAHDKEWGGFMTLLQNLDFVDYNAGTDELWPGFPDTNEPVATAVAEALGKGMSPTEMANLVAERLDKFLLEKGWIEK